MGIQTHDEAATPGMGHNAPPTPIDAARAKYTEIRAAAQQWEDLPEVEDDDLDDLTVFIKQVKGFEKVLDGIRRDEKKPHETAAKEVDQKFKPVQLKLTSLAARLSEKLAAGLQKRREIIEAKQRALAEEAERKRKEAEAAADRAAASNNFMDDDEAMDAIREADEAEKAASAAAKQKANSGGNVVTNGIKRAAFLRTSTEVTISDTGAALKFFSLKAQAEHRDLFEKALIQATKAIIKKDPDAEVPGMKIATLEKAVA